MADDDKGKTIPSGSPLPPDKDTGEKEVPKSTAIKVGDKEYESPDALATAYQSLEGKLGEQGSELGTLRGANKVLTEQIEIARKAAKESAASEVPATDYKGQLATIYKQLDDGDLSVEEALRQTNALTAEVSAANAVRQSEAKLQEILQNRDAEAMQKRFIKKNPDFETLRDSGELEKVKQMDDGEMHDDFSAYYALKAAQSFEEGKKKAAELAAGDEHTKTVLTKAGESIKQTNKPKTPLSEPDLEASMLSAFKGADAGGA